MGVNMGFSYSEEGPTADLMIEAWGKTLARAFANAALAMFNAMTPLEGIEGRESRAVEVEGDDIESLLFNFLDELLYVHETELIVFSGLEVKLNEEDLKLRAVCRGEHFDLDRHPQGIAIKAVTFHMMEIRRLDGGWTLTVVLDT
ncbi:MAG: archease [Candidatus Bathyarchaeota archaeon]|nr:MAG: archease [Candidatus Bathyarchaeota archaeon]